MESKHMSEKSSTSTSAKVVVFVVSTLILLVSWCFLFAWMVLTTESFLVPWDLSANRMPLGTWQRTLNDYFEGYPGSILPATTTILMSICIFLWRMTKVANKHLLPLSLAITNITSIAISTALIFFAIRIPSLWLPPKYRFDEGYERSWIAIVVLVVVLVLLFVVQLKDLLHNWLVRSLKSDPATYWLLNHKSLADTDAVQL